MTKVIAPDVFRQHFDNLGDVLNGGLIFTFEGGTSTPATTWTSSTGTGMTGAQENPIELDSAGREPGGIWITPGVAYKFILKTAAGVTLDTVDNIVVGAADSADTDQWLASFNFQGTPGFLAWLGGQFFDRTVVFPVDFAGSYASSKTDPGSDYAISVKKNDIEVGTITISAVGAATFATTGGATVTFDAGDEIDFYSPVSGSVADVKALLIGDIS